jgi:hypothetical protein
MNTNRMNTNRIDVATPTPIKRKFCGGAPEQPSTEGFAPPVPLDFGAIGKKTTKARAKAAKPVVPDDEGELAKLADYIADTGPLVRPFAAAKKHLADEVLPYWFVINSHKVDPASTLVVRGTEGRQAEVSVVNRYSRVETAPEIAAHLFHQSFKFEIDGDLIPAERAQAVINALQSTLAEHGCLEALSVTSGFVANPEFHARRHIEFSPEQNMQLNHVVPAQVRVK